MVQLTLFQINQLILYSKCILYGKNYPNENILLNIPDIKPCVLKSFG